MKTLIELYDEQPMRNVLATEMFRPEETVLICPPQVAKNRAYEASLKRYFEYRGCPVRLTLISASLLDAMKVAETLRRVIQKREDCAIDISGGTDAALFAAGAVSGSLPVFTYSRKQNRFFEIQNAPFARSLTCTVRLDAASCFLMAGGVLLPGREDNAKLRRLLPEARRLFELYLRWRKAWNRQITYIQHISDAADPRLRAEGPRVLRVDRLNLQADAGLLQALAEAGLIRDLQLDSESVAFTFPDPLVRFWLRDVGAALEIHVWQACLEAGCFDDVVLSAVVNWDARDSKSGMVSNEIDVMAVSGVQPLFISCKTCEIHTEALNELAILRDRFGGTGSRAMIVTSSGGSRSNQAMRKRAMELGIQVVDLDGLSLPRLLPLLRGR